MIKPVPVMLHWLPSVGTGARAEYQCQCGVTFIALTRKVTAGITSSCGCHRRAASAEKVRTHGMTGTLTYRIWASMIQRCNNPKDKDYKDYGGRGITVSEEWLKFDNFFRDMGVKPPGLSIDRRENDEGYGKGNCRWATAVEQANNKRSSKRAA